MTDWNRPMILRAPGAAGMLRINASFAAEVGFDAEELINKTIFEWIDPEDVGKIRELLEAGRGSCSARHQTKTGGSLRLNWRLACAEGGPVLLGMQTSATPTPRPAKSVSLDHGTVSDTVQTIAHIVEEQNPGYFCSILLLDKEGQYVAGGGGPSLPDHYNRAVEGLQIGPFVGSCGTATFWNVPVIVEDIQADVLWKDLAPLAQEAGVAACWSHPFSSRDGRILGALALYAPEPRAPTNEQLARLRAAAQMTGLAVERGRAEEALREREAELRRQRERELELEAQLRQAAKLEALGVLAGGVAHDFNNLLGSVRGNAELAMLRMPEAGKAKRPLETIVKASDRATALCRQMLAFAGRGKRVTGPVEVNSLLGELGELLQVAISKQADVEYALHAEPIYVQGDQSQLEQVAMNLVTNASEALGDEAGRITITTDVAYYQADALETLAPGRDLAAGEYVRFVVRDTGSGMDAETRARIFDPFFTTKFTGRGLGLAAVTGIVRTHGGVILLESEVGVGTTFTVLLPRTAPPAEEAAEASRAPEPARTRKRVLVVDDEEELRVLFAEVMDLANCDTVVAADGEEAVAAFRADPHGIDCVLLDLSMPKQDGKTTFHQLRDIRTDVPVVLISGSSQDEVLELFQGEDLAAILSKPTPIAQLVDTILSTTH